MGLTGMKGTKGTKSKNTNYEAAKAGSQIARLISVYDLGIHEREFKGEELPEKQMVVLVYGLMNDLKKDGTEKTISTGFTFPLAVSYDWETGQLHEKSKLYKHVTAMVQGAAFDGDLIALLGKPVTLTVVEKKSKKGDTFAVIGDVGAVPDIPGFEIPPTKMDFVSFDTESATKDEFDGLPDYVKSKVEEAVNFDEMFKNVVTVADSAPTSEEEVPF